MSHHHRFRLRTPAVSLAAGLVLSASLLLPASGQVRSTGTSSASDDEPIKLKPFEVTESGVHGYSTTSSLAGARMAVPLLDTPASIIVIDEKLIDDVVAESMSDTLNLVSGMFQSGTIGSGLTTEAQYSIRGYTSSGAMRDGIPDYQVSGVGGFTYTGIERIEIAKGPAGVLFGQHNAGGVVNLISKRPLSKPATKITGTVGSYDMWKGEIDVSNFFDSEHRFGYRLAASMGDTKGELELPGEPGPYSWAVNPSLSYEFDSGLKLWAWAAMIDDRSPRRINTAYELGAEGTSGSVYYPMATEGTNTVVLRNTQMVRSNSYELGATKGFHLGSIEGATRFVARYTDLNSDTSRIRSSGTNHWYDSQWNEIPSSAPSGLGNDSGFYGKAVNQDLAYYTRTGMRLQPGNQYVEAFSYSLDTNLNFNLGPTKHNFLVYAQYIKRSEEQVNQLIEMTDIASAVPADVITQMGWQVINGHGVIVNWPSPDVSKVTPDFVRQYATVNRITSWPRVDPRSWNFGATDQISLFDDRLIAAIGARYDYDKAFSYPNVSPGNPTPGESLKDTNWTTRYGLVYKFYKGARGDEAMAFYNRSGTYVTVYERDIRLATLGQRFPNRTITTDEVGLKASLMSNRLTGTVSYFDNVEDNILLQGRDNGNDGIIGREGNYNYPGGQRTTKGWEADISASPLPGWDVLASYSRIRSMLSDGLPGFSIPLHTYAAVSRYEFMRGPLQGFSALWQVNYWGRSLLNRSTPNFYVPSGTTHTAVLGYHWNRYDVRLRVENVFDDIDAIPSSWWTQVGFVKGRNYRLSLTYSF